MKRRFSLGEAPQQTRRRWRSSIASSSSTSTVFFARISPCRRLRGILHGVRPTKIVHRFIGGGLRDKIVARLQADYEVALEKASYMTDMVSSVRLCRRRMSARSAFTPAYSSLSLTLSVLFLFPLTSCQKRKILCAFSPPGIAAAAKAEIRRHHLKVQSIYTRRHADEPQHVDFERMPPSWRGAFTASIQASSRLRRGALIR